MKQYFAMKVMDKRKLYSIRSVDAVKEEVHILSKLIHPFILNLHYAFHDNNNAYMVTELLKGGDLRYHMNKDAVFSEK